MSGLFSPSRVVKTPMNICPACQHTYSDEIDSCPRDGVRLAAEVRDERECPYCAELILKTARVCKHCEHDVEPLTGTGIAAQTPPPPPPQNLPDTRSPQTQGSKPVAAKPPWLRTVPEPPGTMKFVAVAVVALILIVTGPKNFSQGGPRCGEVRFNPSDGLQYAWIPAGSFQMGCPPDDNGCYDGDKPPHQVTLTRGFWLGQTEVTVGAYKRFAAATGRQMPPEPNLYGRSLNPGWGNEAMPIVDVNWNDAHAYCTWAGGRLPTETEWEYSARAGSTEARYSPIDEVAWYGDKSGYTIHEVGQKRANGFGLFDMLGNAEEWVNDWYNPNENYYQISPSKDPCGPPSGVVRVVRGKCLRTTIPRPSVYRTASCPPGLQGHRGRVPLCLGSTWHLTPTPSVFLPRFNGFAHRASLLWACRGRSQPIATIPFPQRHPESEA